MKIITETPRLILRQFLDSDDEAFFELDSNPKVMKYIGIAPLTHIDQTRALIKRVQNEYETKGVGRLAVVLKSTNELIGWAGLKHVTEPVCGRVNYYDVGYRFIERFWGRGYGYEAAQASVDYGIHDLKLKKLGGLAMVGHKASRCILEKTGLQWVEDYEHDGQMYSWYELDVGSGK